MPKTVTTLTEELIIANIDGDRLKSAFRTVCAVAKNERPTGDLAASAEAVHDLQEFADKLADLSKAISTSIKNAEGVFFDEHGDVTEGFKLKNTGSTTTVKDVTGLLAEAALLGYNEGAIRTRMTVSAKDAMEAMGIDKARFEAEFAEFIEIKKKADSLVRTY